MKTTREIAQDVMVEFHNTPFFSDGDYRTEVMKYLGKNSIALEEADVEDLFFILQEEDEDTWCWCGEASCDCLVF